MAHLRVQLCIVAGVPPQAKLPVTFPNIENEEGGSVTVTGPCQCACSQLAASLMEGLPGAQSARMGPGVLVAPWPEAAQAGGVFNPGLTRAAGPAQSCQCTLASAPEARILLYMAQVRSGQVYYSAEV